MPSSKHMFVIGTMGLGLSIALFLDGMYGGKPKVAAQHSKNSVPSIKEQEEEEEKEELNEVMTETELEEDENGAKPTSYLEMYKKQKEKEEQDKQQPLIEEINANAYRGDGSRASRRLYLLQQAYRASREATPIIPVDTSNIPFDEENEDDEELAELIDLIEKEEKQEVKERNLELLQNDRKRKINRNSRRIVIDPAPVDDNDSQQSQQAD